MFSLNKDEYNPAIMTDTYKWTHWLQYPLGTNLIYSYLEARSNEESDEIVFFGAQPYLDLLDGRVISCRKIEEARELANLHFKTRGLFNYGGWMRLFYKHDGILPIRIRAVEEGSVNKFSTPLMTIENTDPEFPWLTNYLETIKMNIWYPCTVATRSRKFYKLIHSHLVKSGTPETVRHRLHDFGMRGVSCPQQAGFGGAAHHICFDGSDNIFGSLFLQKYYDSYHFASSIPAAEHSTVTSWGKDRETECYDNLLNIYKDVDFACPGDSYDIFNATENIWGGTLRDKVLARGKTFYNRSDSGPPVSNLLRLSAIMADKFGSRLNSKGYRVLNDKVRLFQSDKADYETVKLILEECEKAGWSADNYFFGSGGGILQEMTRDNCGFSLKCSYMEENGIPRNVFKESPGKPSKSGRFLGNSNLKTVFENGQIVRRYNFEQVRENSKPMKH